MPSRRSPRLSALFGMSYSGGKIFGKWRCNNRILVIMTGGPAVIPSGVIEKEADMSICPEGYMPRVVDAEVQECLAIYGAVEICGNCLALSAHAHKELAVPLVTGAELTLHLLRYNYN